MKTLVRLRVSSEGESCEVVPSLVPWRDPLQSNVVGQLRHSTESHAISLQTVTTPVSMGQIWGQSLLALLALLAFCLSQSSTAFSLAFALGSQVASYFLPVIGSSSQSMRYLPPRSCRILRTLYSCCESKSSWG